jgi:hypothetical protein
LNTNKFCYSEKKIDCHNWISRDLFDFYKNLDWISLNFFNIKKSFKILWNINPIHTPLFYFLKYSWTEPGSCPVGVEHCCVIFYWHGDQILCLRTRRRRRRRLRCTKESPPSFTLAAILDTPHRFQHHRYHHLVTFLFLFLFPQLQFGYFWILSFLHCFYGCCCCSVFLLLLVEFRQHQSDVSFYFGHFSSEMWSSSISISIVCLNA